MKTAAAVFLLLFACTGPNPHLDAAGAAAPRAGRPSGPTASTGPGRKADEAERAPGAAGGDGVEQLDDESGAGAGGAETQAALPPAGGAPSDAEVPACPGPRAEIFPEAPQADAPSGDCPVACHRLAGCSSYETGGPDLCPCLADGEVERVERACLVACGSEQGQALLSLIHDSPSCSDLVAAAAEAFDPYAAACGATLAQ